MYNSKFIETLERLIMTYTNNNKNTEKARREKGTGSITRRPNGSFMGRISIDGTQKTVYGKSENEVKKKLNEYKNSTIRGENIIKKISVNAYIENWLHIYKKPTLKASSYDRLERTYLHHINKTRIGLSQLGNFSTESIQNLINEKGQSLSFSSVKKIYELFNSCLKQALVARDINFNPVDGVILPKQTNMAIQTKRIPFLTKDECKLLLKAASLQKKNGDPIYQYAPAVIIMLNTGLRIGELLALTWDKIDFENRLVLINATTTTVTNRVPNATTKTKSLITNVKTLNGVRYLPLNTQSVDALEQIKAFYKRHNIKSDFVICTSSGNMVTHRSFQTCLDRLLIKAELPHIGTHSLRHSFACLLLETEKNIKVVSDILGHGSTSITYNTYIHTKNKDKIDAVNALDSI
jgi:integrase